MKNNFLSIVAALAMVVTGANAQPGQGTRFIGIAGPTMLTEPGTYMLTASQTVSSSSGAGITIMGNNITLDLNGQSIMGTGTGAGVSVVGARNVTVKNGIIEGALMGVVTMNSTNVKIEGLMIRGRMGAPPEAGIMMVATANSVVMNNQILNTALGIFVRGGGSFGNRIEGNTMTHMGSTGPLGICYNPSDTDPQGPKGDLITRNLIRGYRQAVSITESSEYNVAEGNTFIFRNTASTSPNATNLVRNNTEVKIN
ncbi:MAG: hypothetical protein FJW36_20375 [Acidobacteria bacterium]|nr:hypothetical protein [Acidobacteriota bacterium]